MNSREAFEKLFKNNLGAHGCQFDLDSDGNYEERETFCAWFTWQEQQKVIDEQHKMLLNQAKAMLELQEQNRILQNAVDIEEQLKIELQKRIDAALEIISCLTDEYTKSELEKALRGGQ